MLVGEQAALIVELRAEVADLWAWLSADSCNSSWPPSSDGLSKPSAPKSLRRRSGRKPGGQSGHEGRHLGFVERPEDVVVHVPDRCGGCGGDLFGGERVGEEAR